ncbi:HAMP domain-containing histidine kinase [Sporosarcina sp. E16_3]|uniref:sensor histidine kinase n=1 Tax=Sporosarcina sp. E16_3 TaxID=2789293 RepID=UPI001A92D193|nr:HAMP domain-containing sensor histidine kinase [Sporosarcina sp. E16_3]MBO0600593.1 HAMP domain-containing histidine kinase [Sporosarcina sp. E16_3]
MLSKNFFKKTKVILFLLLMITSLLTVGVIYITSIVYSDNRLKNDKIEYYKEQTYRMSNYLSSNIVGGLNSIENIGLYEDLTKKFSIQYELVSIESGDKVYKNGLLNEKDAKLYYFDVPVLSKGTILGNIRTYYDLNNKAISLPLETYQRGLEDQHAFVAKFTIIFLTISSFLISGLLTSPMKSTYSATIKVLQGKRDIIVPKSGTLEMAYLVDTINSVLVEFSNMENWRKQMMEDLTHEIRTPLTSVLLMMEAIIDGIYPTNEENLQDIYEEVDRLSRLIFDVQNLSEAEGARFKLNIRRVNMIPLIKSTYDGFLFVAKQKNIKLHFSHPNRPCLAAVDSDRFIQVITNFISNAIKYTPDGGAVEIGIKIYPDEMVFYCLDNGSGISEEDQVLVFNRFYRVEKSRSRENGGLGIGLNICNALAKAHGWEIGLESKLNEGSRFWVKIPIQHEALTTST